MGESTERRASCRHCGREIVRPRGLFRRSAWMHADPVSRFCPPASPEATPSGTIAQPMLRATK